MQRVHLIIRGRVQGVFFRAHTAAEARRLGVGGWVRNRDDGTVEVTAEGPEAALHALIAWCYHGPPMAKVSAVDEQWDAAAGEVDDFAIR